MYKCKHSLRLLHPSRSRPALRVSMRTDTAQPVHLSAYLPSDYLIDQVDLDFRLHLTQTQVTAKLHMRPNPKGRAGAPLVLDGDSLTCLSAKLDGAAMPLDEIATPDRLTLANPPAAPFVLELVTQIDPSANTQLMGLYRSGSAYCTQCEAEGFRRITYFLDRPDILSVYTTRLEAVVSEAPVLLGNGNPVEAGAIAGTDRHYAIWHDPHPKPAYLFAIVGGNLAHVHQDFLTKSGRKVALGIYVEHGRQDRAAYAMDALVRSMRWDEDVFGREYDLDVFNIVAVSDFNMGAMENKGLNVFNDKYVLALPDTATDADYAGIETVIAHEYFHNWTGNRITCRDWFQLCLKEGLTVFRDQEFSSDQRSRAVKRIADVRTLRSVQFAEDAGPLAHNVHPETYLEINNFYTATVYEKGAEVIRTLRTWIGADAFRAGMDLYFQRYDGTAATIEDFIGCFAEASGRDLAPFMRWYDQAGTPIVRASGTYDAKRKTYTLDLVQSQPDTPGQSHKKPSCIPVVMGLVKRNGGEFKLVTDALYATDGARPDETARATFELSTTTRRITFQGIDEPPVPSLLRGLSAPVKLDMDISNGDLLTLLAHDTDSFNRWQAVQTYATRLMIEQIATLRAGGKPVEDAEFMMAMGIALGNSSSDPAFAAQVLSLPSEADLARDIGKDVDPDAIHDARVNLRRQLSHALGSALRDAYEELASDEAFSPNAASAGRRAMRNAALDLYAVGDSAEGALLAKQQFDSANNMTDRFAALAVISHIPGSDRETALDAFFKAHAQDALVIDKWFALQAMIPESATYDRVLRLMKHPTFSMGNPNRLRSLIGVFATANPTQFNAPDGRGYDLVANVVLEIDPRNPQVAARLLSAFRSWRTLEPGRRAKAQAALQRVANTSGLSADVTDIVQRSLA